MFTFLFFMLIFQLIGIVLCITQLTISVFAERIQRQLVVSDTWNCLPGIEGINSTMAAYRNESEAIFHSNKESDINSFLENFFDANGAFLVYKTSCCGQKNMLTPAQITFVQHILEDIKASAVDILKNASPAVVPTMNLITSGVLSTANQIKNCLTN
ncbi:hypothetical protein EDC96DRAFT_496456 [Choanephora cucurbitarum]|nr:hypothetical protein EDC96DRAFT_496456 [Choanephora cucurbitarum]